MNGLINSLFPICNTVDRWFAAVGLNATIRIGLWGILSGIIAMGLYGLLSRQGEIRTQKERLKLLGEQVRAAQDAEFQEVMRLANANLLQSLNLLRMVFVPTLLSGLPVLVILLWLPAYYAYQLPAADVIKVQALPSTATITVAPEAAARRSSDGLFEVDLAAAETIQFADDRGSVYDGLPLQPPTAIVHPRRWWSWMLGNEAGYVRAGSQVETLWFGFDPLRIIPGVPDWLSGWQVLFFPILTVTSLLLKVALKIE